MLKLVTIDFLFCSDRLFIYILRMDSIINRIQSGFNSADYGLPADFLLTKLTQMKGCGCKVPRAVGSPFFVLISAALVNYMLSVRSNPK